MSGLREVGYCSSQLLARLAVARQIPGLNFGPENPSLSNSDENKKVGPLNKICIPKDVKYTKNQNMYFETHCIQKVC